MLKLVLDTIEELPEAIQSSYKKNDEDGKYYLQVQGLPELQSMQEKVKEFRNNNIEIMKERDNLKMSLEKIKNIDPEKYKELLSKEKLFNENKMYDDNAIDELVASRTERMRGDYDNQIKAFQESVSERDSSIGKLTNELARERIDNQVQKHVLAVANVAQGAMDDVIRYGSTVFTMNEDMKPVALDANGHVIPGKDGASPLSIEEWASNLPHEKPYFFTPSEGSGSEGNRSHGKGEKVEWGKLSPGERIRRARAAKSK